MEDELKDFRSICVIQGGLISFVGDLFRWASDWCDDNGYCEPIVRNTPSGAYEIMAKQID